MSESPSERRAAAPARRRPPHFQHGPIDCIVAADGESTAVEAAIERAWQRFETILAELVAELPLLRADLSACAPARARRAAPVARRMVAACRPHAATAASSPRWRRWPAASPKS